jgi:hypothetical protein
MDIPVNYGYSRSAACPETLLQVTGRNSDVVAEAESLESQQWMN